MDEIKKYGSDIKKIVKKLGIEGNYVTTKITKI